MHSASRQLQLATRISMHEDSLSETDFPSRACDSLRANLGLMTLGLYWTQETHFSSLPNEFWGDISWSSLENFPFLNLNFGVLIKQFLFCRYGSIVYKNWVSSSEKCLLPCS